MERFEKWDLKAATAFSANKKTRRKVKQKLSRLRFFKRPACWDRSMRGVLSR